MYSSTTFNRVDVTGVVHESSILNDEGKSMAWCKRLKVGTTEFALFDTKKAKKYLNVIEEHGATFQMDDKANQMNRFLRSQVEAPVPSKVPIRVLMTPYNGSSSTIDCGDHHAVSTDGNKVFLRRLEHSCTLRESSTFRHVSEQHALDLLQQLFHIDKYTIGYECITVHEKGELHYTVDFVVRLNESSHNLGVEVKKNKEALDRDKALVEKKMRLYTKCLGSACVLLIMEPHPTFYKDTSLEQVVDVKELCC